MKQRVVGAALRRVGHRIARTRAYRFFYYLRKVGPHRPRTFNEKVVHRKVFEHDPRMPPLVDKIEAKSFVRSKLGDEWVIPLYFSGPALPDSYADRNWPLPFVVKPSHRGGGRSIVFVRKSEDADWPRIDSQCTSWTGTLYGQSSCSWANGQIAPRILVEQAIGGDTAPIDFKFLVFDSRVAFIQVDRGRFDRPRRAIYDRHWRLQPFGIRYRADPEGVPRPSSLDKMIEAAECLGEGWPFVRIDFYEDDGIPKFGEFTFYPTDGRGAFHPPSYDRILGDLWKLDGSAAGQDRGGADRRPRQK